MKNFIVLCGLLLTSIVCVGNNPIEKLEKAISTQDQQLVKQILTELGHLSLYNQRKAEEMAQEMIERFERELSSNKSSNFNGFILWGIVAVGSLLISSNMAQKNNRGCAALASFAVLAFATTKALSYFIAGPEIKDQYTAYISRAENILELIKQTRTT